MSESHAMKSMNVPKLELKPVELEFYKSNPIELRKDIGSLFNVTKHVLHYSTSVANRCLLGEKNEGIESKPPTPDNRSNFARSILKQISCKVACGDEGDVFGSIEKITSSYSWAERAVLTLAAFAWSYGEFLCEVDIQEANRFAPLISWPERPDVIEFKQNKQLRNAIADLKNLTSLTLSMIESILVLEKLSNPGFDIEHQLIFKTKKIQVEYYSRLAISAALACMAQVNYLTFDRVSIEDAIHKWISTLKENHQKLQEDIKYFKTEIVDWAYWNLGSCFRWPKGIVLSLTWFTYPQEPKLDSREAEKPFGVEVLTDHNVLLFISEVTIPTYDLLAMQRIHHELSNRNSNYKIVWVPMVKEWAPDLEEEFVKMKKQMPWYILCYETNERIVGIEYIKRQWQYCYRPMAVVLNSQGGIECPYAMQIIRIWGFDAFVNLKPGPVDSRIHSFIVDLIDEEIEGETYIFLYGGTKKSRVEEFETKLIEMTSDVNLGNTKIAIVSFSGEKANCEKVKVPKKEIGQFWNRIDSLLYVILQYNQQDHPVTKDIERLLSIRNEQLWAALCTGSKILMCASGDLLFQAVADYSNWTKNMAELGVTFEDCFWNYIRDRKGPLQCRHVSLENCNELPAEAKCPDCNRRMERMVTYKCCHPTSPGTDGA